MPAALRRRALCFAMVLGLSGCLGTTLDASYASMADAIADGAVHRGWIPEWVPATARDLREVHDLDINVSALAFDLPAGTHWRLPADCIPVRFEQTPPAHFRRGWWPSRRELKRDYAFFECRRNPDRYVFVGRRHDGGGGLHWRAMSPGPL